MGDLTGTNGLIVGVANKRSLAWVIAKAADEAGAKLTLSYANERFAKNATKLAETLSHPAQLVPCDVSRDDEIETLYQAVETEYGGLDFLVHGVAFASRESLSNPFVQTTRPDFLQALDVSAYSLVALARGHLREQVGLFQHALGLGDNGLGLGGDDHFAGASLEQGHAQLFFQLFNSRTEGRLADVAGLGGVAKVAFTGQGDQIA